MKMIFIYFHFLHMIFASKGFMKALILIIISFNNLKKMTTLPFINLRDNKIKPREHISYLRFPSSL